MKEKGCKYQKESIDSPYGCRKNKKKFYQAEYGAKGFSRQGKGCYGGKRDYDNHNRTHQSRIHRCLPHNQPSHNAYRAAKLPGNMNSRFF